MTTTTGINYPRAVSRAEWLKERLALLAQEKELTKARDRLNTARRNLPMVRVDQDYVFEGPAGKVRLLDLFAGRLQLLVFHFMWRWENGQPLDEPCKGCSAWADQLARGHFSNLHHRHTSLALITRGPRVRIDAFKARMGWKFPMYSSFGTRFNHDFGVTIDSSVAPAIYNYRTRAEHEQAGTGYYFEGGEPGDLPGMSSFLRRGDEVFPHVLDLRAGGRAIRRDQPAAGHDRPGPPGRVGGAEGPRGQPHHPGRSAAAISGPIQ